ncbi:MAG: DUF4301 family protein [Bacteroidetes bacterium]|nr:DUF4301 family protein [Bacteroidota bacterium]
MILQKDIEEFQQMGIDVKTIERQIENFKNGFPFVNLIKPAFFKDGIIIFEKNQIENYTRIFDNMVVNRRVLKFVPASGAASRMFQHLYSFRDKYKGSEKDIQSFDSDNSFNSVHRFIAEIKKFAFYNDLKAIMEANQLNIDECIRNRRYIEIINYLLDENGLGYGVLPKGLLKFHHYNDYSRTSIEEHLVEAASYSKGSDNIASIHFTLSPEHIKKFNKHICLVKDIYEKRFNVSLKIDYSIQKLSTDTVAVDMNNDFFREEDGKLLFRPGGHGALIENLNDLQGDIIFIKNIDNIVPDKLKEQTFLFKKVIGGYLISLQQKTYEYLHLLNNEFINDKKLNEIIEFAVNELMIIFQDKFETLLPKDKVNYLYNKLNRPIRVCGMVKNEGEPGGGPFWVRNQKGEASLQIVESSQINLNNSLQSQIFKSATHFNPVDLVCGVRNYRGEAFDLKGFVDSSTGFISTKSKDGRSLKAQELPGLWNGAMADWISVFVEVPIITFNPVKTINDLLRVEHQ